MARILIIDPLLADAAYGYETIGPVRECGHCPFGLRRRGLGTLPARSRGPADGAMSGDSRHAHPAPHLRLVAKTAEEWTTSIWLPLGHGASW